MSIKEKIKKKFTPYKKVFEFFIQFLILLSILSFSIETLPHLKESTKISLNYFETAIQLIFSAEYLIRLFLAKKKSDYAFSFFGIIDLIVILPFYLSLGVDLRSLRIFRMLRLFRMLKLIRYNNAMIRLIVAIKSVSEELILFSIVTLMLLYLSAVGIYYFEHESQPEVFSSIFHSLWWAVTTLTTVGYGDTYPITIGGRLFTFFILMLGLGVVAIPSGLLASALSQVHKIKE